MLLLLVVKDSVDPWGMTVDRFRDVVGEFVLADERESARFAGVERETLPAVRVIEDGPVRTVIEACFAYENSRAILQYRLPKEGCAVDVSLRLLFAEKDKMVKLSIPTALRDKYLGQVVFGVEELYTDGRETVSQQWTASVGDDRMLTLINDGVYGSDYKDGEIRTSLLRGAAYCAHPINDRVIMPQDRFMPRIDQGERLYRFVLEGGESADRLAKVGNEAQIVNEPPYALSFFPDSKEGENTSGILLEGEGVQLTALRYAEDGEGIVVRLFESSGIARTVQLSVPLLKAKSDISLTPFELKTLRITKNGSIIEDSLLA